MLTRELKKKILAKLDEINQYLEELEQLIPAEEEEYLEREIRKYLQTLK